ncbi:metallophosphoesterase [Desulfonema magnum]|uniref:Metallophosphoesterase n=1 Tax=Desulfonema magnum TaxID=45655 RepID=A0A975BUW2_9BACT|nr:metallophosphoesterase [Desulfonema magnum]QTA91777.1 Metallophosphoesterase [Desulfonema magnum]
MKIAVISDIHGHCSNLAECVKDIREKSVANIVCLGDVLDEDREANSYMMLLFRNEHEIICPF